MDLVFFQKMGFPIESSDRKVNFWSEGKFPIGNSETSDRKVGKFRSELTCIPKKPHFWKNREFYSNLVFFQKMGFPIEGSDRKAPIGR